MALGGVLAATDRRYRARAAASGTGQRADGRRRIGGGSDVNRFLIPAAIFLALAGVLYVGVVHSPNKSTMQSALLGKPVPAFALPVLGSPARRLDQGAARRPALGAQRLGHLVRRLPRRASTCCSTSRGRTWCRWSGSTGTTRTRRRIDWLAAARQSLHAWWRVDRDGRTAIDFGVYGAPETFFIDADGRVQYRHVGADDAGSLAARIPVARCRAEDCHERSCARMSLRALGALLLARFAPASFAVDIDVDADARSCRSATTRSRTSCAACSARTRASPIHRWVSRRTCAATCASSSSPARPTHEIRDSMVARYGNVILFRPPFDASTAWVWMSPFLLLLVGVFVVACVIVRQRSALVAGDDSVVDTDETRRDDAGVRADRRHRSPPARPCCCCCRSCASARTARPAAGLSPPSACCRAVVRRRGAVRGVQQLFLGRRARRRRDAGGDGREARAAPGDASPTTSRAG